MARVQIFFDQPSLTRQEFKDECDLGLILERFKATPEGMDALSRAQGFAEGARFEDVSAVPDYRSARDAINAANASFMALPAIVRRRFDNDAAMFYDFMQNDKNYDEAVKLGLVKPKPIEPTEAKKI